MACVANTFMSAPVSAINTSAVLPENPGMLINSSRATREWAAPRFPDCGFRVHLRGEL